MSSKLIKSFIAHECITPDFPKPGVNFVDIFPVIEETCGEAFRFYQDLADNFPLILLPEARGFLFYAVLGAPRCLPLRKAGKLPGDVVSVPFTKEYGSDTFEYQSTALTRILDRMLEGKDISDWNFIPVLLFDDLSATCGTAAALIEHFNSLTYHGLPLKVTTFAPFIELATEFPQATSELARAYGVEIKPFIRY